jgi:hypothetical protein
MIIFILIIQVNPFETVTRFMNLEEKFPKILFNFLRLLLNWKTMKEKANWFKTREQELGRGDPVVLLPWQKRQVLVECQIHPTLATRQYQ